MKFAVLVNEGPYTHQSSDSAYHFIRAALDEGHEVLRVFFYHDGVNNGTRLTTPPQDDRHIPDRWSELSKEHGLDLVVCVAAAQRRGVVDADEQRRNRKDANILLIEDGVYGALKGSDIETSVRVCLEDRGFYVLGPDLKARGISEDHLIEGIEVVDYKGFVKLAANSPKVQSWL
ncbi:MAG: sulfurtransferase complex subunit TusD [Gammaproteobacteria bacterium]|nr:sulfurtransferase complex subunit TusD [Gammaproteobacteria bacterium]